MIDTSLAIEKTSSSSYLETNNSVQNDAVSSDLFDSDKDETNSDMAKFSKSVINELKKDYKSNKEFTKETFNSFTMGKNGKFSLGKTWLNAVCAFSTPIGWAASILQLGGSFISHKINSEE